MLRNLAGLTRLQYVFCYPAKDGKPGDIVIAGPAEPWALDAAGRAVGLRFAAGPSLQLDDLAVALRAFPPTNCASGPFLGCTIDPPAGGPGPAGGIPEDGAAAASATMTERAAAADAIARGVAESLGQGRDPRVRHLAAARTSPHVLVEADYRMKRIGIGAEPPPVKMTTFLDALQSPQQGTLQRWWFTPDYKCVKLGRRQPGGASWSAKACSFRPRTS